MSVCTRYTGNDEEAIQILNESFLKVFRKMSQHKTIHADVLSFKRWLKEILIDTIIERFFNHKKLLPVHPDYEICALTKTDTNAIDHIPAEKILTAIRNLSPLYRTLFNLYVVEELDHDVIAKRLNISVKTSKINLSNARSQLRKIILEENCCTGWMVQSR